MFMSMIYIHFCHLVPNKFLFWDGFLIFKNFCPRFLLLVEICYLLTWPLTKHVGMRRVVSHVFVARVRLHVRLHIGKNNQRSNSWMALFLFLLAFSLLLFLFSLSLSLSMIWDLQWHPLLIRTMSILKRICLVQWHP